MGQEDRTAFVLHDEMRNFAEIGMEQARAAFDSFVAATQKSVNSAQSQAINAQSGAREVGELALQFAERNFMTVCQFAQHLIHAKDPQEMARLHTDYVNGQISALADQAKELSQKVSSMAGPRSAA